MVVIQTDPIWNDEFGLGPPSSLKITLKRRLDFCLPCPSSQISSSNSKLRTNLVGLANTGLPHTSCHFSSNFHSLLMEQRRLLKMTPHPKRTSRSQKVMEILARLPFSCILSDSPQTLLLHTLLPTTGTQSQISVSCGKDFSHCC